MKNTLFFVTLLLVILIPATVIADSYATRRLADSEFDIAQKAYRSAVSKFGENLDGLPAAEKKSACKKIEWALYDNKIQYETADPFTIMRYKRQLNKLNKYNAAFGCTN